MTRARRRLLPLALAVSAPFLSGCLEFSPGKYCAERPQACELKLSNVEPAIGFDKGGTQVTLIGRAFEPDTVVTVDGVSAYPAVYDSGRISLKMPSRAQPGRATITARHAYGEASLPDAFLYLAYPFQADTPSASVPPGSFSSALAVADMNGDGKPDVLTANPSPSTLSVLISNGNFSFQAARTFSAGKEQFRAPSELVPGDFNNDGKTDVAVAICCGLGGILLGNGDGTLQPAREFPRTDTVFGPFGMAKGDFNRDGKLDLASGSDSGVNVLFGKGDGTFQPPVRRIPGSPVRGVHALDMNGDGFLDIITTRWVSVDVRSPSNQITVSFGDGEGSFPMTTVINVGGFGVDRLFPGDIDSDGKLDLITIGFNDLRILLGNGNGTFKEPLLREISMQPGDLIARDFDADGKVDLLLTGYVVSSDGSPFLPTMAILYGSGQSNFISPVTLGITSQVRAAMAADLNQDGKDDVITIESDSLVKFYPARTPPSP